MVKVVLRGKLIASNAFFFFTMKTKFSTQISVHTGKTNLKKVSLKKTRIY